jgi:hypothetical protein
LKTSTNRIQDGISGPPQTGQGGDKFQNMHFSVWH